MRKKILLIGAGVLVLAVIGLVWLNIYFLPLKLKSVILEKAQEALGRKVTAQEIHFSPLSGFTLKGLIIYEKAPSDAVFLHVEDAAIGILYTPFIQQKKVILSSFVLKNPSIRLSRAADGTWNFDDLFTRSSNNAYTLLLAGVTISGGKIYFSDALPTSAVSEVIENIELRAKLSMKQGITYHFSGAVPKSDSSFSVNGKFDIASRKLTGHLVAANILLEKYLPLYLRVDQFVFHKGTLRSGQGDILWQAGTLGIKGTFELLGADFDLFNGRNVKGNFKTTNSSLLWQGQKTSFNGNLEASPGTIRITPNQELSGTIRLSMVNFLRSGKKVDVSGDLLIAKGLYRIGEHAAIAGDLKTTGLVLSKDEDTFELRSGLALNSGRINFDQNQALSANFSIPDFTLGIHEGQLALNGNPQLSGVSLTLKDQELIADVLRAPEAKLTKQNKVLTIQSRLEFINAKYKNKTLGVAGSSAAAVKFIFNADEPKPWQYSGMIDTKGMTVSGLPYVDTASGITGQVHFMTDKLTSDSLKMNILSLPVELSGDLKDFSDPLVDLEAAVADVDLSTVLWVIPQKVLSKARIISFGGKADLKYKVHGKMDSLGNANFTLIANLKSANLKHEKLAQEIKNISGELRYSTDALAWKNLQFTYQSLPVTLNGKLENFEDPVVDTTIISQDLDLNTRFLILKNGYQFQNFVGTWKTNSFDVKGDIAMTADVPHYNLHGDMTIDLGDLGTVFPTLKDKLAEWQAKGIMAFHGKFIGIPQKWRDWTLSVAGTSAGISLKGHRFRKVNFIYEQAGGQIERCDLSAQVYDGAFTLKAAADASELTVPFRLTAELDGAKLEKAKEELELQNQNLSGNVSGFLALKGPLANGDKIEGSAQLKIEDGYLGEMNLFRGLGKILFIPEYQDILFTEASADFVFKRGKFVTDNLEMTSNPMTLKGGGWIDLKGNINFDIVSEFDEKTILESSSLKRTTTMILTQGDRYLNVKISGTIKEPQTKATPIPFGVLQKTRDLIKEGLKSIF